jgi:hypothetical protein
MIRTRSDALLKELKDDAAKDERLKGLEEIQKLHYIGEKTCTRN